MCEQEGAVSEKGAAPAGGPDGEGEEGEGVRPELEGMRRRVRSGAGRARQEASPSPRRVAVPSDHRFERFTERAKQVLVLAQEEARRFNHNYIGTEHLLLGLIREGEGIAAKALAESGIELDAARDAVEYIIGRGDEPVRGDVSLTPRSKKVVELAFGEAHSLGHGYVGTEHLLLGLVREGEGIAAGVLESLGAELEGVSRAVLRLLADVAPAAEPGPGRETVVSCRVGEADLAAIDMLVEAGIRGTRSEAAQWLIHAGVGAHKALFAKVEGTVGEIRRLRDEARQAAWQVAGDGESLLNITSTEEPQTGAGHPRGGERRGDQQGTAKV
jgi:hypothetical protein